MIPSKLSLHVPLDRPRRLDADAVEDRWRDVDRVVVLVANLAPGLDPLGPGDHARIAATAVELVALPHLERRVERHRPTIRVMVVGLRAPEFVDHREVRLDVIGNLVHELVLVERAVGTALAAGAVVGDQHDDRDLELLGLLQIREQAADLIVGVGEEGSADCARSWFVAPAATKSALLLQLAGGLDPMEDDSPGR